MCSLVHFTLIISFIETEDIGGGAGVFGWLVEHGLITLSVGLILCNMNIEHMMQNILPQEGC